MIGAKADEIRQMLMGMNAQQFNHFAQQHAQDAMVFPLVYEVGKMRKAAQNQQAMQQPQGPTVSDKALQEITMPPQMAQQLAYAQPQPQQAPQQAAAPQQPPGQNLPENTGIAAAAPPSAGHFAHGGIVGFADGGQPRTINSMWGSQPSMWDFLESWGNPDYEKQQDARRAAPEIGPPNKLAPPKLSFGDMSPQDIYAQLQSIKDPKERENALRGFNAQFGAPAQSQAPSAPPAPSAPVPQTGIGTPPSAGGAPAPQMSAPQMQMPSMMAGIKPPTAPSPIPYDVEAERSLRAEVENVNRAAEEGASANRKDFEAYQKARGEYGTAREARIKEAEGKLEKQQKDAGSIALIKAGLAIMGAPGGRGFGYALAQAIPAINEYGVDMDKLEAKRDKLRESMDALEDVRFRMKDADAREERGFKAEERKIRVDGAKRLADLQTTITGRRAAIDVKNFDGFMKAYEVQQQGYNQLQATDLRGQYGIKEAEINAASREHVANIEAAARENVAKLPTQMIQVAEWVRKNNPEFTQKQVEDRTSELVLGSKHSNIPTYAEWVKSDMAAALKTDAEKVATYNAVVRALTGGTTKAPNVVQTPGANATVLPQ